MRRLQVYPKAYVEGSTWHAVCKVYDLDTKVVSRFYHAFPSAATADESLVLLKIAFNMTVPDGTLDSEIDDALFALDIKNGPGVETVWGNWQAIADAKITALGPEHTNDQFVASWSPADTGAVRTDARRALITLQSGWAIDVGSVHQHEGDGTVKEE